MRLRRPSRLAGTDAWQAAVTDDAAVRRLLASPDARLAGIGLELARATTSAVLDAELASLADDPRADVRVGSLAVRAAAGDADARRRLADEVRQATADPDAAARLRAARAMGALDAPDRAAAAALLADPDPDVRNAAFDAVAAGDSFALEPALAALPTRRRPRPRAARSTGWATPSCRSSTSVSIVRACPPTPP